MLRYEITSEGKLGNLCAVEEDGTPLSCTAYFRENEEGQMTLLRWPRLAREAVLPERIQGKELTEIAATAFAPEHLAPELFTQLYGSVVGYSVFCMKMGRHIAEEELDEGGPLCVQIPKSVKRIGEYAFWKCRNLKKVRLPACIRELPAGVFGECSNLQEVVLPGQLTQIGYMPRATQQVMPDAGAFAGCHCLKRIVLPDTLLRLGAQTFNSAGLEHIVVMGRPGNCWNRQIEVERTAFSHTASLLWMDKAVNWDEGEYHVEYRIGLPVGMDKILDDDRQFGVIKKIPVDFFTKPVTYFDRMAQTAFRLDFSGRMALARLAYDGGLLPGDRKWYLNLLVEYYAQGKQFMPVEKNIFEELFLFLENRKELTAIQMSNLIRTAGQIQLPAELISHMMDVRRQRYSTVTGFEDLEL